MARSLYDDLVEYEDGRHSFLEIVTLLYLLGTEATSSQMAKDITTFLAWAASPEHDDRKLMGAKAMGMCFALTGLVYYIYRHRWAPIRNMYLVYKPPFTSNKSQ